MSPRLTEYASDEYATLPVLKYFPNRKNRFIAPTAGPAGRLWPGPTLSSWRDAARRGQLAELAGDVTVSAAAEAEARQLKRALAGSGFELVLIISDYVYLNVVCRHPSLVSPDAFQPVRFQVKYTRARTWTYLPRHATPVSGLPSAGDYPRGGDFICHDGPCGTIAACGTDGPGCSAVGEVASAAVAGKIPGNERRGRHPRPSSMTR